MNKHTKLFVAAVFTLLISACVLQKKTVSDSDMEAQGFVKAMVISYDVDGCGYMLELVKDKPEGQHECLDQVQSKSGPNECLYGWCDNRFTRDQETLDVPGSLFSVQNKAPRTTEH
jgi:hypothetical protein